MKEPPDLFARRHEWDDLVTFATSPGPGIRLAVVRGRRRQGKSHLLRRLADAAGGFYHQAVEESRAQALAGLGAALAPRLGAPGGRLALADWDEAISALAALGSGGRPTVVVLDELPYLLAHSPELPSVLQRAVDRSRDGGAPVRLVVCGSALSVMGTLLGGTQALRGRASLDVVVREFDARTAARFWGLTDARVAFLVDAVVGGTPGYRDLVSAPTPRRPADLARWLERGVLNPSSALFREDEHLLAEERTLGDRALYHAVLSAVASGATSQGRIAATLGREARAVQHPLRALEESGFVTRTDDALRSSRPFYRIADPVLRFHHVVTRRDLARFEERRTADAWRDARDRFSSQVLGPHFEHLVRTWAMRWASPATLGGPPAVVAPAVVNDARGRTRHEVDLVVRGPGGGAPVLVLGEAKHRSRPCGVAELERLVVVRDLVAQRHPSATGARLLVASASGFTAGLRSAAEREGAELVDLERLYGGD